LKTRTIESWSKPVCNQSELGDGQVLLATVARSAWLLGDVQKGCLLLAIIALTEAAAF
jgi:hypothetical protein